MKKIEKNSPSELETVNIYIEEDTENSGEFNSIVPIELSMNLSREEKLILLCDQIENSLNEIVLNIESVIDGKYAVVSAVEKNPMHSYLHRKNEIEYTLNQVNLKDGWFDKVIVVYDSHTSDI